MSSRKRTKPRHRTENLIAETVGGEVLLYKLDEHKALRLNAIAGGVWSRCDGTRTVAAIARDLAADLGEPVPEELVEYTVARLSKAGLLAGRVAEITSQFDRRQLIARLGIAAGALPVIFALTAPRAFAQGSEACVTGSECGVTAFCFSPCYANFATRKADCSKMYCDEFQTKTGTVWKCTDMHDKSLC